MTNLTVSLFPLPNSITLNKVSIPYHIFEPRYIRMVQESFKLDYLIGVLLTKPDGDYTNEICIGGKPSIIRSWENGELDIVITGTDKCRLKRCVQQEPYLIYTAESVLEDLAVVGDLNEDLELFKEYIWHFIDGQPGLKRQARLIENLLVDVDSVINYATLLLIADAKSRSNVMKANTLAEKCRLLKNYLSPSEIDLGPYLSPLELRDSP